MSQFYINEAFKRLRALDEEAFDLSDDGKLDDLRSFVSDDIEAPVDEPIIDTEAEEKEDLQDNYVGKVILECSCCHTRIYKDEEEVVLDEESGLANMEDECPVCNQSLGYNIIGKIEPFDPDADPGAEAEEVEDEIDDENDFDAGDDLEDETEDDGEFEESFKHAFRKVKRGEEKKYFEHSNLKESPDHNINEWFDDWDEEGVCVRCGERDYLDRAGYCQICHDDMYGVPKRESLKNSKPKESSDIRNYLKYKNKYKNRRKNVKESVEVDINNGKVTADTDDVSVDINSGKVNIGGAACDTCGEGGEMISPLSPEDMDSIENNQPVDMADDDMAGDDLAGDNLDPDVSIDEPVGGEEPNPENMDEVPDEAPEDEEPGEDIDLDTEGFEYLGESFLSRVYDNVKSFKVNNNYKKGKSIFVEGLIKFESGKSRPTRFIFESTGSTLRGKHIFEGRNDTFSKSKKAFVLKGRQDKYGYMWESMTYNFNTFTLNESNKNVTTRVYGRIKRK